MSRSPAEAPLRARIDAGSSERPRWRADLDQERVQFEVNHKAATRAGLHLSSRLLGVAKLMWL
jgi:YfiR/HmsC-like